MVGALAADRDILADFLNDMRLLVGRETGGDAGGSLIDAGNPETDWGDLVLGRADDGEVIGIDPERYWDGIATWFRAHGDDPHRWRSPATASGAS